MLARKSHFEPNSHQNLQTRQGTTQWRKEKQLRTQTNRCVSAAQMRSIKPHKGSKGCQSIWTEGKYNSLYSSAHLSSRISEVQFIFLNFHCRKLWRKCQIIEMIKFENFCCFNLTPSNWQICGESALRDIDASSFQDDEMALQNFSSARKASS